jgi:ankyrin repeat protein
LEAKTPYGQTPLYLAAMGGHQDIVGYLLDKGARTDVHDTFCKAALLDFVLDRKHYAVAKLIIAKGNGNLDEQLKLVAGAQYELLSKNPVGEPILATPALAGDMLLVRGAKHLFAIAE